MRSTKSITHAVVLGLIIGLVGLVVSSTGTGVRLEQRFSLSWLFALRGSAPIVHGVVMVTIDEKAVGYFSSSTKLRDWRRRHHAELVDKLVKLNASVIAFDLTFDQPRPGDEHFANSARQSNRVIFYQWADQIGVGQLTGDRLISPTATLADAASGLAPFPLPEPSSGRTDRFWTFFGRVNDAPTMPVVALQMHLLQGIDYAEFLSLLDATGIAEPLPKQLNNSTDLLRLMSTLRTSFRATATYQRFIHLLSVHPEIPASSKDIMRRLAEIYRGPPHRFFGFYGPPMTIPHIQYEKFWQAEREAIPDLTGKVVFIGATEPKMRDNFYTVYTSDDGQQLNGVEMLATAFANLLNGQSLRYPSGVVYLGLVLGFGILAGLISGLLTGLRGIAGVLFFGVTYLGSSQLLFNQYALWFPLFIPLALQLPLGLLIGSLSRNRWLEKVGANLKQLLGYHVPAWVVENSERNADPVNPQNVHGVCLISDVAGYTSLAERVRPEPLALLSNDYFNGLIERIKHYQGEMISIVGDGLTSVWRAGQSDRTDRLRACLAALDMLDLIAKFNRQHPETPFPTRIGLHCGWFAMGDLGGSGHFCFGLAGDIVNTTSRIEGLNKYLGTELLATEEVVQGLDELLLRRVGRFQLKGKDEAVIVYQILNRQEDASDAQRQLRACFEAALYSLETNHWRGAEQHFADVIARFPTDGPSRFYSERYRSSTASQRESEGTGMIRMEFK